MDKTPSDYIELGRWFRPHDEKQASDVAAAESYLLQQGRHGACGWSELISQDGVHVVLGEAGSGRTYEFKARANLLRAEGTPAFFLSLHKLTTQAVEQLLDDTERQLLKDWQQNAQIAFFFLDAVDESKLIKTSDFREALESFTKAVQPSVSRAKIFISSRVKDWLPITDRRHVADALGFETPTTSAEESDFDDEEPTPAENASVKVWTIAGLERHQVQLYVDGRGVADSGAFINALSESYAWELAVRPLDVNLLVEYWRTHHRMGRPAEMFEHLISAQLKERPERAEYDRAFPLDMKQGRSGAETLAAATILCRKLDFRIDDEQIPPAPLASLDARDCLPDHWKPTEIHALFSRPLFDAAIYGTTRFHHRSLAEYLAAKWLMNLLNQECPVDEVLDLLFQRSRGQVVVKQSRLPVAVWLACIGEGRWVIAIRQNILECAPESFFRFGDPSLLPASFKVRILDAVVQRFSARNMVRFETSDVALSRMGEPGLAAPLIQHLSSQTVSDALKIEFAKLARVGRVHESVPVALQLLNNTESSSTLTTYCMWLVEELGTPDQLRQMTAWIESLPSLTCDHCWQAVQMLFPLYLTPQALAGLLPRLSDPHKAADHLSYSLQHAFDKLVDSRVIYDCLRHLLPLVEQPPHVERYPISQTFAWLAPLLRKLIKPLLTNGRLSGEQEALVARSLWIITQDYVKYESGFNYQIDGDKSNEWNIELFTKQHPQVRRQAFWLHYHQERLTHDHREPWHVARWAWAHNLQLKHVNSDDFRWVLTDLASDQPENYRLAVLHLAVVYWKTHGRTRRSKRAIEKAIDGSQGLRSALNLGCSRQPLVPIKLWWKQQEWNGVRNRWWWKGKWQKLVQLWNKIYHSIWLVRNRKALRKGQNVHALYHLLEVNEFGSKWAPKSWDKLTTKHGKLATCATQEGCVAVWKDYDPPQDAPTNAPIIVGLAGLQYMWMSGFDFFQWTSAEAEKATRYAIKEMNGFSDWFPALARAHPQAVTEILGSRIEEEWRLPHGSGGIRILDRLRWSKSKLGSLVVDRVFNLLLRENPVSPEALYSAIQLLLKCSNLNRESYANLIQSRLPDLQPAEQGSKTWLVLGLQTHTRAVLDLFDQWLANHSIDNDQATELVINLCGSLDGRFYPENILPEPEYIEPWIAPRFIRWVHHWVRAEADIRRGSGSYSPTSRDHAQTFRGSLLGRLANQNSLEAEAALISLLNVSDLQHSRDYLLYLLDGLSRRLADGSPWVESSVRLFEVVHQAPPLSCADLFGIACRRLHTIKSEVEQPFDVSVGGYVRAGDNEDSLRRFLAMRLSQLSHTLYTNPQEAVIAGELRPDLRIEKAGIVGSVPIEVKLADERSINSLVNDLEGQLVGDYLSSYQSRYGLFVIGFTGDNGRNHWHHPTTNALLSFPDMIEYLRCRADELLNAGGFALGLAVVGIDFRPRPSVRRS